MLQCAAMCCNACARRFDLSRILHDLDGLQVEITSVLQCVAVVRFSVFWFVAVRVAVFCSMLQCVHTEV